MSSFSVRARVYVRARVGVLLCLSLVFSVYLSIYLSIHAFFFIRNWSIRKQYSAPQKVEKVQYWSFEN